MLADLLGQEVQRIEVHEPTLLHRPTGEPLQCYGAVAIWTATAALILRSPLRYGAPTLSAAINGAPPTEPTATLCCLDEAAWVTAAIGRGWREIPAAGRRITSLCLSARAIRLESPSSAQTWLVYREDFDGSWLMTPGGIGQVVDAIELGGLNAAFGWLLPEAPYRLHWNGRNWQDLATAWLCADTPDLGANRDRLFQQLYCLRLVQHPNLLRRFAALRYPVRCTARPWLADQIAAINDGAANG